MRAEGSGLRVDEFVVMANTKYVLFHSRNLVEERVQGLLNPLRSEVDVFVSQPQGINLRTVHEPERR